MTAWVIADWHIHILQTISVKKEVNEQAIVEMDIMKIFMLLSILMCLVAPTFSLSISEEHKNILGFETLVDGNCSTTREGVNQDWNKPCKFPFVYNNVTYNNSCASFFQKELLIRRYWCATETNSSDHHLKWGYCGENCLTSKLFWNYWSGWFRLNNNKIHVSWNSWILHLWLCKLIISFHV